MSEVVKEMVESFKNGVAGCPSVNSVKEEIEATHRRLSESGLSNEQVAMYLEYINELSKMVVDEGNGMYFVSMNPQVKSGVYSRNNGKSYGMLLTDEMLSGEAVAGGLVVEDGVLKWGNSLNIATKGIYKDGDDKDYSKGISFNAVAPTEDNPILFVLCNEIGLYQGIEADLKLIRLDKENFIAALITGACMFNGVPLQRCNNANLDNAKVAKVLTSDDLFNERYSMLGKVLGEKTSVIVDYSYDALLHGRFLVKADGSYNTRTLKSKEYIFDPTTKIKYEEKYRLAKEEAKKQAEHEKLLREIRRKEAEEAMREKERREAEEREAKITLKKSGVKIDKDTKVKSVGAADFLKAVAMHS